MNKADYKRLKLFQGNIKDKYNSIKEQTIKLTNYVSYNNVKKTKVIYAQNTSLSEINAEYLKEKLDLFPNCPIVIAKQECEL